MSDDSDFEQPISPLMTVVDIDGKTFDINAGETWIYPINFPVRDYQFNIIQNALFHNTLVSLPTGLGKTFIAAVLMYNFYRWYPLGKIVFLAPTRPLVKQQMDACYNITAIPTSSTTELTGNIERKSREVLWKNKRVFFITPQVLLYDLDTIEGLGASVRCIVFDEAHKASGNHPYVEVMRKLVNLNDFFRVLALSATPGKDVCDITTVIQNLLISHLEFRTEESSDVQKYVFQTTMETLIIPLDDKMMEVKDAYLNILEGYTRCLMKYKIIQGNCNALTKGKIFMTLKDFQAKNNINRHPNYSEILRNLNVCVTLYHAYELLIRHGLRSFVSYFEEHLYKPLLRGNVALKDIVKNVKNYLNQAEQLNDSFSSGHIKVGHPKFLKLREILLAHFTEKQEETRVIVFFEYRDSAKEAHSILLRDEPLIRSRIFLGQSSGMRQKTQFTVVKEFKEGKCNTLLSTCIGEEGLDVGEVDLIICFDVSNRSPIRMVQRSGRTGRKRNGHIIVLVTQGREQQTLEECLKHKKCLPVNVSTLSHVRKMLYTKCPRMIPNDITPHCEKVYFTVEKNAPPGKKLTTIDMFKFKNNPCTENINGTHENKTLQLQPQIENRWNKSDPFESGGQSSITYNSLDTFRRHNMYSEVGHSTASLVLISLLQFADCSRFNIPLKSRSPRKNNFVQGDIRDIFKQSHNVNSDCNVSPIDNCCNNNIKQNTLEDISDETYSEIVQFLNIRATLQNTVNLFQPMVKKLVIPCFSNNLNLNSWVQPNMSVLLRPTRNHFLKQMENKDKFQVGSCRNNGISAEKALTYPQEDNRKNTDTQRVYFADNNKTFNETKDSGIIEILNFFKLTNLEDVFVVSKFNVNKCKKKDKMIALNPAPQMKHDDTLYDSQNVFNLTNKHAASITLTQDIMCEFNDFVDVEDIFDTSNRFKSNKKCS